MIKAKRLNDLAVTMDTATHTLVSGLPLKMGGRDEGPNPHEFLEGALAACTSLTCQMYANRKGMKLKSANVTVRILAEGRDGSKISREISFEGELSAEEKARLLEIANKCPVHILLESQILVENKLID